MSLSEIEALLAQAEQVEKQSKERKSNFVPGPSYDVLIPKWGQSKQFKYHIGGDEVFGEKMLAVIVGSYHSFIRWGHKDHDTKQGPLCQVRGYYDPTAKDESGAPLLINKSGWEVPRPSPEMTITAYRPFGSRKNSSGETLSCAECRGCGMNKSEIPTKFGGEDKCENEGYLEVVVFRHMVKTDEGNLFKTVNQTNVGQAYLAKLPLTSMAQAAFMNFVFDLAKGRRMSWKDVLVQIKIEEEKIKSGALIAKLDFSEMDPDKEAHKKAVEEAKKLHETKIASAKTAYNEKKGQNPVAQVSGNNVPFATGQGY